MAAADGISSAGPLLFYFVSHLNVTTATTRVESNDLNLRVWSDILLTEIYVDAATRMQRSAGSREALKTFSDNLFYD